MKIRISYLVEADDDFRAALAHRHGRTDLATREEIVAWYIQNGSANDDDLMEEWRRAIAARVNGPSQWDKADLEENAREREKRYGR